mgnify:CR=1 FL=1
MEGYDIYTLDTDPPGDLISGNGFGQIPEMPRVCIKRHNKRYSNVVFLDGHLDQRGAQFLRNFINQPDPAQKIFAIPVLVFAFLVRRHLVAGVTLGAVRR